jgi:hypothetical protein
MTSNLSPEDKEHVDDPIVENGGVARQETVAPLDVAAQGLHDHLLLVVVVCTAATAEAVVTVTQRFFFLERHALVSYRQSTLRSSWSVLHTRNAHACPAAALPFQHTRVRQIHLR